jgi:pyruvate formate lyase activating enzyme
MESPTTIEDMTGIIDAFNIDLKSFDSGYYKKVLKGDLNGVLDTLKLIRNHGFWLEVTTLIVPDENDSDSSLKSIANFITSELGSDTPWHISAFYPHYKMTYKNQTPAQSIQRAFDIGKASGLKYIYKGNVAEKGITYCPGCGEELIIRNGYFVTKNVIQQGACPYCNTKINGIWN